MRSRGVGTDLTLANEVGAGRLEGGAGGEDVEPLLGEGCIGEIHRRNFGSVKDRENEIRPMVRFGIHTNVTRLRGYLRPQKQKLRSEISSGSQSGLSRPETSSVVSN